MNLSTLYDKASDGSIKQWSIDARMIDGVATIVTEHGKYGMTITTTYKAVKAGKNIGKANETTPLEQAESEAKSTWQKKKDAGHIESLEDVQSKESELLPMLAHKFKDRQHDIKWPAKGQPKLNGCRCFAQKLDDKTIRYTSRKGKVFSTVNHLTPRLLQMMSVGQIMDGELYKHDWSFQRIISAVKKLTHDSTQLEFWIYDTVIPIKPDMTYQSRYNHILNAFQVNNPGSAVMVETIDLPNAESVKINHDKYAQLGYEGIMVRNSAGKYTLKHRSADLQKYKSFIDSEFKIIGGKEGEGSDAGCVVFRVITDTGREFSVRPKGTVEYRKQLYRELPQLVGKLLTVRYQELSEDGIPIFPVGVIVRDYED